MHTSPLYFASSNENKFSEIEKMLNGEKENRDIENRHGQMQKKVKIIFLNMTIKEIQSDSIIEVAEDKVKKAFDIIKKPVIIEDDG
ncbi:MAG TPA: non-canonical purine NTP pyrophosphatase, partial [Candidatus Nitrosocosmicus sp.]|nr:non-canonical purine NTP pyrophosphatase [Candidatus Nitrosocosmicus sp.]